MPLARAASLCVETAGPVAFSSFLPLPFAAFFSAARASGDPAWTFASFAGLASFGSFAFLSFLSSDIDHFPGLLGKAHLASVRQILESDPRGFARLRIDM